jgi:hypothetical protein
MTPLALLLTAGLALADDLDPVVACGGPCGSAPSAEHGAGAEDPACVLAVARCLLERRAWPEAVEFLKSSRAGSPEGAGAGLLAGPLARMLSVAYEGAGNMTWARRVLADQVASDPSDAETRTWAAWRALSAGDLAAARAFLSVPPAQGPFGERQRMLQAVLADLEGNPAEARALLLHAETPLPPGDEALRQMARRKVLGDTGEPFSARIQAGAGFTTNAVQSAPQEIGEGSAAGSASPIASLDTVIRWEPWTSPRLRPTGEARFKGLLPTAQAARPSAWIDLAGRGGAELGSSAKASPSSSLASSPGTRERDASRVRLLYSFELLGVNSGDTYSSDAVEPAEDGAWPGRRWYMEAHRAEIEADLGARVQLFAGVGRRVYRDTPRTRNEADGGAALVLPLGTWNLTGVLSGRAQDARLPEWDLIGSTALLRVAAPLPGAGLALVRGMLLLDRYNFDDPAGRRDLTWGLQVAPWTRPLAGIRYGVSWTLTDRTSSEPAWSYVDHRFLLEARWLPSWGHRSAPVAPAGSEFLPLPYGLDRASDTGLDRVQDLLRQEDGARRGSSCVD